MAQKLFQILLLGLGVLVTWWLLVNFVLPLLGAVLGLLWLVLKVALLAFLIYWAYAIFKRWNGDVTRET